MLVCVKNESKGSVLAQRVKVASSIWARGKGLLGTASLAPDEGMLLRPCNSVHTFFMRFAIDVLFLDKAGIVVSTATLPPWKISKLEWHAISTLEFPAGTLERSRTEVGDRISIQP